MDIQRLLKSNDPVISICICALSHRLKKSKLLFEMLCAQGAGKPVEILVAEDCGENTSGSKRHALSSDAFGEYIAFVDDDDLVTENYIDEMVRGCRSGLDIVSFNVRVNQTPAPRGPTRINIHSLATQKEVTPLGIREDPRWGQVLMVGMFPNHLCAWRKTIQRKIAYDSRLCNRDDAAWIEPMIASQEAQTEHRIPKVLYVYHYSNQGTVNQTESAKQKTKKIIGGGLECFREGTDLFIAYDPIEKTEKQDVILCRDCDNNLIEKKRSSMEQFHVYKLP